MAEPLYTNEDVRVWATDGGAVFYAPKNTALPEKFDEPLADAFIPVGILSEDGPTEGLSVDTNKIKGWPGGRNVRVTNSSTEKTISFTMIQNSPIAAKLYWGAGDPVSDGGTGARVDLPESVGTVEGVFVLEKHDGNIIERRCIELGQVSDRGDQESGSEDAAGKEVTLESVSGDYILTNDPSFVDALTP